MINLSKDLQNTNSNAILCPRKQREFIPDARKDDLYWDRRRKNNEAAKRSREKRRISDLMLETRVLELTRENALLLAELYAIKEAFRLPQTQHYINRDSVPVQINDLTCRQRRPSVRSLVGAETTSDAGSTSSSVISTSSSTSSLLNSLTGPAAAVAACLTASCHQHQQSLATNYTNNTSSSNSNSNSNQQQSERSASSPPPPPPPPPVSQVSIHSHLTGLHNNNSINNPPTSHLQHVSELIALSQLNDHYQFSQLAQQHAAELLASQSRDDELRDSASNSSSCLPLKLRHKVRPQSFSNQLQNPYMK